jgi:hypothetical protein
MTARGAYKEWREDRKKIESNHMYFYYETRERLAALDSASATTTVLSRKAKPQALESETEAEGAAQVDEAVSEAEHEAQEFMDENEDLLDEGGYATLQRIVTQGLYASRDLSVDVTGTANQLAAANQALAEAIRNPNTRPRKLFELEREVERLKPVYDRKNQLIEELSAFMDRAKLAYKREGGELPED